MSVSKYILFISHHEDVELGLLLASLTGNESTSTVCPAMSDISGDLGVIFLEELFHLH